MATAQNAVRVLIVADDRLTRAGLAALLEERPGCVVVGRLTGQELLSAPFEMHQANVAAWDLGWDAADSIERLASLADEGLPVVALVANEGDAADAWAGGARGVLPRDATSPRWPARSSPYPRACPCSTPDL